MPNIVFTKHALGKFQHPSVIKLGIKRRHIKSAIVSPDYFGEIKEQRVKFVLKKIDHEHNLRVIYKKDGAIIIVITFHPAEIGRYENI